MVHVWNLYPHAYQLLLTLKRRCRAWGLYRVLLVRISGPRVHRMADGSAKELDRLRCLGNGIVPAQSRYVAELIKLAAKREEKLT